MSLKFVYYAGVVLKDPDTRNLGRYKVHVPELQLRQSTSTGIWCRNRIHAYRVNGSDDGVYGSYYPLHTGTKVTVSVANDDYSSASIVRINIHEKELDGRDSLPFNITDVSRDDLYMVLRTPKYDSVIVITEDTDIADEPSNSMHIYHHNGDTKIIMDSNGIHINTIHHQSVTIGGNSNVKIGGNASIHSGGSCSVSSGGAMSVSSSGNVDVNAGGPCSIKSNGAVSIDSSSSISLTAPGIALNGGSPGAAPSAPTQNAGYETFPSKDKELDMRKADKRL